MSTPFDVERPNSAGNMKGRGLGQPLVPRLMAPGDPNFGEQSIMTYNLIFGFLL